MKVLFEKRYKASYTVEATYIMAMVIFSLFVLIRTAYIHCLETSGGFQLHYAVYRLRGQEEQLEQIFAIGQRHGSAVRKGKQVEGVLEADDWNDGMLKTQEIEMSVHAPEEWMRMMTIFQADEELWDGRDKTDGDQLPSGDEE